MRRLGAFLGVLALLVQMGVSLAHEPVALGAAAPLFGAPLCHVGGGGGSQPPAPEKSAVCPICLSVAANACFVAPPGPAGLALAAPAAAPLPLPLTSTPRRSARGDPAQPRGPPALV